MQVEGIEIGPFLKAFKTFELFRHDMVTERDKAGAIQAFEFCYELAWKTLKRILSQRGIETRSPRDCFREAALNNLIADPKIWFRFIEIRNITVHTYDETTVEEVLGIFEDFSSALKEMIHALLRP